MDQPIIRTTRADKRRTFLLRASVRFDLVEAGEISLQEAIDGLAPLMHELIDCRCYWATFDALGRRQGKAARR
jgi:hypothetical protein